MKKKVMKSVSLVALSAVMLCGTALTAACGGSKTNSGTSLTIRVSMFCDTNDENFNRSICNEWAAKYTEKLIADGQLEEGQALKIEFTSDSDSGEYFKALQKQVSTNSQPDVFYVSPKYVRTWRAMGKVIDLTPYLTESEISGIWESSISLYADSADPNFTRGDLVAYDAASGKVKTEEGVEVGIYGLPKDYSSFGLGFNAKLFSDEVKEYLTTHNSDARTNNVSGAEYSSANLVYSSEPAVAVNYNGEAMPGLINIGVPTYYKPYNFYQFANFSAALAGGDPMASMVQKYTGGKGYCVTIPGFPGESFEEAKKWWPEGKDFDVTIPAEYKNEEAEYNQDMGYITYTYAEYSALTWVMTYYYNTFLGGVDTEAGRRSVYGNDQYDGTLYLLPWLAGNDAQYLNESSTSVVNKGKNGDLASTTIATDATADTYKLPKTRLNGSVEQVDIQYGVNSENFLETIAAFHAYGSDWNGNSNNCGDTTDDKDSGWLMFCAGNQLFYGKGTWDTANMNKTDRNYLEFRLMPEPVSEDYALASWIKNYDFKMQPYGDVTASGQAEKSTGYTAKEIFDNQLTRQDKWGARMDSVGYGVSSMTTAASAAPWRAAAAVDLVKYLTVNEDVQVALTYAGAQLPNYRQQCRDFYTNTGAFAEMITPDADDPNGGAWAEGYELARKMKDAFLNNTTLIKDWLNENGGSWITEHGFDERYANDMMKTVSDVGYAMKVLRLVASFKNDRDISLRMQFGLNASRDSATYTYNDNWITLLDPRGDSYSMAYVYCKPYQGTMMSILDAMLDSTKATGSEVPVAGTSYATSAWIMLRLADRAQEQLQAAITEEEQILALY